MCIHSMNPQQDQSITLTNSTTMYHANSFESLFVAFTNICNDISGTFNNLQDVLKMILRSDTLAKVINLL